MFATPALSPRVGGERPAGFSKSAPRTEEAPRRPGLVVRLTPDLRSQLANELSEGLGVLAVDSTNAQQAQLLDYLDHLLSWNARINLSAITDPAEMLRLHLLDALSVMPHLAAGAKTLLDVGTGPGLPAVPIAIQRPNLKVEALDSVAKKVNVVNEFAALRKLNNLRGTHARVEDLTGGYDIVISRAYASVLKFIQTAGHLVAKGGQLLTMKSRLADEELSELRGNSLAKRWALTANLPLHVPRVDAARCLLIFERL